MTTPFPRKTCSTAYYLETQLLAYSRVSQKIDSCSWSVSVGLSQIAPLCFTNVNTSLVYMSVCTYVMSFMS
jgi:hypothetical protein